MIAINSSNIRAVDYSEENQTLLVEFQGGKRYRYSTVPANKYKEFMAASSKGQFLAQEIKGVFPVEGPL